MENQQEPPKCLTEMLLVIYQTVCLQKALGKQNTENCIRELTFHLRDGSVRKEILFYNHNI